MIDAVVDEVLKEMGNAANEAIMAADDYMDAETGLLVCGKCHTRKEKRISFLGEERIVCCLCRCAAEELEKAEKERKDGEIMEGISRLKTQGCIANALMDRNIPVLMTSFPKLINALGGLYNGERNEYLQNLNHYPLLIIDDLGVERDTPYVLETVYLVIDERYKSGKPFIITTNLSLQELQNPVDLEHGRIYDRIMERCTPVVFSGRNYRTDKGRANRESVSGILRE